MAHSRKFRFGIAPGGADSSEAWVSLARRAEELGYSTLLVPDHFVNDFPPMPALAYAAAVTTKLRVGTFVIDNDFRHPALVAKEAATLDLLSGGRFELGIGAGWHGPEYEMAGIPFESPGVRVSRLEEAVQIIKSLFTEESTSFSGEYYTVKELPGLPRPAQRPHPPILMAGGGKRVLSMAARHADIVGVHVKTRADGGGGDRSTTSSAATAEKIQWVRESAGDRFDDLELNMLVSRFVLTDDPRKAAEELATRIDDPVVTPDFLLDMPQSFIGSLDYMADKVQQLREEYHFSYFVVSDEDMEAFAPVVARLNGK
jgi:probable F420-dependent oxidoreductase